MTSATNQTESVKRIADSSEQRVISTASDCLDQGKPLHLLLVVNEEVFKEGRKKELEPMLGQYGEILRNYDFSHAITIELPDLEKTKKIVEDYEAGRLEGIVGMEMGSMDAVLCDVHRAAESESYRHLN